MTFILMSYNKVWCSSYIKTSPAIQNKHHELGIGDDFLVSCRLLDS